MFSSFSGSRSGNFAYDADKPTLNQIYKKKIVAAEKVHRPMPSGPGVNIPIFDHQGVVVTTESNERYLIHHGSNYGKSSDTVLVDACHMSDNWESDGSIPVNGEHTVGEVMMDTSKGNEDYCLFTNNCYHAQDRACSSISGSQL